MDGQDPADAAAANNSQAQGLPIPTSKLDSKVQRLMELMCSKELMKLAMRDLNIDVEKFPLGKLSSAQLNRGFAVLQKVQKELTRKDGLLPDKKRLDELSSEFYTNIPHDFGMSLPPSINTVARLSTKIHMIQTLGDMRLADSIIRNSERYRLATQNPLDLTYSSLRAKVDPIANGAAEHSIIMRMVKNTHAPTHNNYTLDVEQIFSVTRRGAKSRFAPFSQLHNRRLLWHGSRVNNFVGILSQGLRIAPPEAPSTGYMFGKGIYFADLVSKSANYCHATRGQPYGLLVLADVALGNSHDVHRAEFFEAPPAYTHSVRGCGKTAPVEDDEEELSGCTAAVGRPVESEEHKDSSLLYNEFIVYDEHQLQIKYLVLVKFNFA